MDRFQLTSEQRRELDKTLSGCHDTRLYRRLVALRLIDQGDSVSRVARTLGVSRQSIHNWLQLFQAAGTLEVLRDRPREGRPAHWNEQFRDQFDQWLSQSPEAYGYFAGTWTVPLLAEHVRHTHGWEPSASTLRRQLHALGYTWKRSRYVLAPDPQREKKTPDSAYSGGFAGP